MVVLLLSLVLPSQAQSPLQSDSLYFRQQAAVYQQWLKDAGIGNTLRVHTIQAKPNALNLFLAFTSEDSDYCHAAWIRLKQDFATRGGLSLEQTLYYKMIQLMETPQESSRILIYDTYNVSKKYEFEVKISFAAGKLKVDELDWKSEKRHIDIQPHNLAGLKRSSKDSFLKLYSKERVFAAVQQYIQKRYTQRNCEQRVPSVELLENEETLRLKANDLCKEVLSSERNPAICKILNCNFIKRERLTFTFSYAKEGSGFRLNLEVDGQYGSGFYNEVGRAGYKPMDTAFKGDLIDYADKLRLEIRQVLLKLSQP